MRFLISRLSSLGDVVCSLPAAVALKAGRPGCEIDWIVDARFQDVVRSCSAVDRVILRGAGPDRRQTYEAALDLQGLLKSATPVFKAKAKSKLGYHWQREGSALFSRRVLPDPSSIHVVDQYVDVARAAGGSMERADFGLVPDPAARERMRALIPQAFVVINPGAAWASKRWPAAHVASLADRIAADGVDTVLIGSKGETSAAEAVGLCESSPIDLTGKTSLLELIALISAARVHVGGDTGSTHIAAALGIPAIGLYSATRPERSCPYGQIKRCHYSPNGLAKIEPLDVYRSVREAIA